MKTQELIKNLIKLQREANILGFSLEEVGFIDYYLTDEFEPRPKKVLGIKILGGDVDLDDILKKEQDKLDIEHGFKPPCKIEN